MSESESPTISTGATEELNAVELGGMLRETRSAFKRDLTDVASELRIRLVYLEAIEEGRLDRLPGPTYASGFLRAYGDYLGLDGEDLVKKFKLAGGVGAGRMDLQLPSPVEEGRLPTGSILLVAAILAFGAYGGWYYLSSQGRDPMKFVASLPEHLVSLIGGQSDDPPETKAAAGSGRVENETPATQAPVSDHTDVPSQSAEEPNVAPETPPPVVAVAAESLNPEPAPDQEKRGQTKIVKKVETVASASTAPAPSVMPTENKPQLAQPPANAPPTPPASPRISTPATADLDALNKSAVIEKTETAISTVSVPPLPPEAVAPAEPETPAVSSAPADEPVAPASRAPADNNNVSESGNSDPVASKPVVNTSPARQTEAASTPMATLEEHSNRVVVRATADSWVEVRSGDQDPMLSKVLHAGEIYEVPQISGLKLATGNAGGIEILVNGRLLPLLGPMGAVRRDVALDAESLLARIVEAR